MLKKIISGGQTGVDRAALDVALLLPSELGINVGGYCPKGRLAEDGKIPDKYPLVETSSARYEQRTKLTVISSDGTLILLKGKPGRGTILTINTAKAENKPLFIVELTAIDDCQEVINWLKENQISTLNIAGSRESTNPDIYKQAYLFLERLLRK